MIKDNFGFCRLSSADGANGGILLGSEAASVGVESMGLTIGVDIFADGYFPAEDCLCARITHDDTATGRVGDNETDRDGVEDCPEEGFVLAESFLHELAARDIDYDDGNSDNLIGFIARGLIGEEQSAAMPLGVSFWAANFEVVEGLAAEGATKIGLYFRK